MSSLLDKLASTLGVNQGARSDAPATEERTEPAPSPVMTQEELRRQRLARLSKIAETQTPAKADTKETESKGSSTLTEVAGNTCNSNIPSKRLDFHDDEQAAASPSTSTNKLPYPMPAADVRNISDSREADAGSKVSSSLGIQSSITAIAASIPVQTSGSVSIDALSTPKKTTVTKEESEQNLIKRIMCIGRDIPDVTIVNIPALIESRLQDGKTAIHGTAADPVVNPVHYLAASQMEGVEYLVFIYGNCVNICGKVAANYWSGRNKPSEQDSLELRVSYAVQESALQFLSLLFILPESIYEDVPRKWQGYHANLTGTIPNPLGPQFDMQPLAHDPNPTSTQMLWQFLVAAVDTRLKPSPSAGSVQAAMAITNELLTDICAKILEDFSHVLNDCILFISWKVLSVCQGSLVMDSLIRPNVIALLQCIAQVKPIVRLFVTTPAFTGNYSPGFNQNPIPPSPLVEVAAKAAADLQAAGMENTNMLTLQMNRNLDPETRTRHFYNLATIMASRAPTNTSFRESGSLSGNQYETGTILGCLLAPSPLPFRLNPMPHSARVLQTFSPLFDRLFPHVTAKGIMLPKIEEVLSLTRGSMSAIWDGVYDTVMMLLRSDVRGTGPDVFQYPASNVAKTEFLNWVSNVLAKNSDRSKEMGQFQTTCSDGFAFNLAVVLAKLVEPIKPTISPVALDPFLRDNKKAEQGFDSPQHTQSRTQQFSSAATSSTGSSTPSKTTKGSDKTFLVDPSFLLLPSSPFFSSELLLNTSNDSPRSPTSPHNLSEEVSISPAPTLETSTLTPTTTEKKEDEFSFTTRVAFYCLRAFELGICPIAAISANGEMQIRHLANLVQDEQNLQHAAVSFEFRYAVTQRLSTHSILMDPTVLALLFRTSTIFLEWLCLVCTGLVQFSSPTVSTPALTLEDAKFPFPDTPNETTKRLPASIVTTIIKVLLHISRSTDAASRPIMGAVASLVYSTWEGALPICLNALTAFLASPKKYVRSPHLRADIGDTIFGLFLPENEISGFSPNRQSDPGRVLASSMLAYPSRFTAVYLAPALMELFGDVEATGHYDKIRHRMKVVAIINHLWTLNAHRPAFRSIASSSTAFVSFGNGVINYTTSALTDALKGLPVIRDIRRSMLDMATWSSMDSEERERQESNLSDTENTVRTSLLLARQTLPLLAALSRDPLIAEAFMRPELLGRLSAMLIQSIETLGGPRGVELKVDDPEKYGFRPRELLRDLLITTLNLSTQPRFVDAVAEAGIFRKQVFDKVYSVVERIGIFDSNIEDPMSLTSETVTLVGVTGEKLTSDTFRGFIDKVLEAQARFEDEDTILADPPDDYLDPLMATLMRDPVKLPSGYVLDRNTIVQHLLQNPSDPFTRAPLVITDVVPHNELKAEIDAWIEERKRQAANK